MSILSINGRTLESLGLEISDQGAVWSAPQIDRSTSTMLGRVGVRTSTLAVSPSRTLTLILPLPESPSARRGALDRILSHLDGLLEMEWSDAPGRVQYGRLERAETVARFASVAWTLGHLSMPLQVVIDTPLWFEREASTIGLAADTPTPVPVGTMPSAPLIEITTATGDITIQYRGITGTVLSSLVISDPNLDPGETLVIDCVTERIFVAAGQTLTAANALYSSGSFPVFDSGDADWANDVYPTIEIDTPALLTYRRVYA